jgi:CRISPR-associated protein (TIGR03986 family)
MSTYRITGKFNLRTNLHIGAGDGASDVSNLSVVTKDGSGMPYIPGSCLKGALRSFALGTGVRPEISDLIFGTAKDNTTTAGRVEFCNAYAIGALQTEKSSHSVRQRHTGVVEEHLFFEQEYVPAGSSFTFDFTLLKDVKQDVTQALVVLLKLAGSADSHFSLGSGSALSMGKVAVENLSVQQLLSPADLWKAIANYGTTAEINKWKETKLGATPPAALAPNSGKLILKQQALNFTSPFMSYVKHEKSQDAEQGSEPDGKSRRNHKREFVLPASSFHGALRSQAERILRTVGLPAATPAELPNVKSDADVPSLDLAALLFGAPGWKSVVELTDFVAPENSPTLQHDMLAIDRITGAGKDGAKFKLEVLDCPRMTGTITVDLKRLNKLASEKLKQALGLLAHTLRDLDEGDIALGYGEAKGYGISNSAVVISLKNALPDVNLTIDECLKDFSRNIVEKSQGFAADFIDSEWKEPPLISKPATGRFHNPYHFVPFPVAIDGVANATWPSHSSLKTNQLGISHALYAPGSFHGKMSVELRTVSPLFVGASRTSTGSNQAVRLAHFKLQNKIALPATSLRGLISSAHETLTCSPMRVADDRGYSVRQQMEPRNGRPIDSFDHAYLSSAIGRLILAADGKWIVEPICLPTINISRIRQTATAKIPNNFAVATKRIVGRDSHIPLNFKVLLDNLDHYAEPNGNSDFCRTYSECFSDQNSKRIWYIKMDEYSVVLGAGQPISPEGVEITPNFLNVAARVPSTNPNYIIGQKALSDRTPLSEREYKLLSVDVQKDYVKGFIRPMYYAEAREGADELSRELAQSRKYELFIPYPEIIENNPVHIPVDLSAIRRFDAIAQELHEDSKGDYAGLDGMLKKPYFPVNAPRDAQQEPVKLQHGDLVFFKLSKSGKSVTELAFSSLWRTRIEQLDKGSLRPSTTRDFVETPGHARRMPLGIADNHDAKISPTEQMFGYVQDRGPEFRNLTDAQRLLNPSAALSGKVRISNARANSLNADIQMPEVQLKILANPKLPSPVMYFRPAGGQQAYVSKGDLISKPTGYSLQGKKAYLHALRSNQDGPRAVSQLDNTGNPTTQARGKLPWQTHHLTENLKQKVLIRPVSASETFSFTIDFKNLSQAELTALCASVSPSESYEHKLGLGKPIGLGSVKLSVTSVQLVDRQKRYAQTSFEIDTNESLTVINSDNFLKLASSHMRTFSEAQPTVYKALRLLGEPKHVTLPVHYAQIKGADLEKNSYNWFVQNSRPSADSQFLQPVTDLTDKLQGLF